MHDKIPFGATETDEVADFVAHHRRFVVSDQYEVNPSQPISTKKVTPTDLLAVLWEAGRQGDMIVPCDDPKTRTIGFSTSNGVYQVSLTELRESYGTLPESIRDLLRTDRQGLANLAMSQDGGLLARSGNVTHVYADVVTPEDIRIASETEVDPLNPSCLDYVLSTADRSMVTVDNADPALFHMDVVQTRVVFEKYTSLLPVSLAWRGSEASDIRVVHLADSNSYRLNVAPCKILGVGEGLLVGVFDRYALFLRSEDGAQIGDRGLRYQDRNYVFHDLSANHRLDKCIEHWRAAAARNLEATKIAKFGDTYDFSSALPVPTRLAALRAKARELFESLNYDDRQSNND